jgi:hypothetical protein
MRALKFVPELLIPATFDHSHFDIKEGLINSVQG